MAVRNFQNRESAVKIPEAYREKLIGNYDCPYTGGGRYDLKPYECIVLYGSA